MTAVGYAAEHERDMGDQERILSLPRNGGDIPQPLCWIKPKEYAYPNESIWDIELICTDLPGKPRK